RGARGRATSREKSKRRGPSTGTPPSRAHGLPAAAAPASVRAAHPGESRPAIRPPSPASDLLDRRKILRGGADVAGPARGLRIGGRGRRSGKQQSDRQGTCNLTHRLSLLRLLVVATRFVAHAPAIKSSPSATANANAPPLPRRRGAEPGQPRAAP